MNKTVYGYVIWDTEKDKLYASGYTSKGGATKSFNDRQTWKWDEEGNRVKSRFQDQSRYVIRPLVLGDE